MDDGLRKPIELDGREIVVYDLLKGSLIMFIILMLLTFLRMGKLILIPLAGMYSLVIVMLLDCVIHEDDSNTIKMRIQR